MKPYSFKNVSVIVGGKIVEGHWTGDDVAKATFNNDMFNLTVGADGDSTRSQSSDRSGKISLKLLPTSDDNAYLNTLHLLDVETGAGVIPVIIKCIDTGATITAMQAWITKTAELSYGAGATAREWIFETDRLSVIQLTA